MTQISQRPFLPAHEAMLEDLRSALREARVVDRAGLVVRRREVTAKLTSLDVRVARSSPGR